MNQRFRRGVEFVGGLSRIAESDDLRLVQRGLIGLGDQGHHAVVDRVELIELLPDERHRVTHFIGTQLRELGDDLLDLHIGVEVDLAVRVGFGGRLGAHVLGREEVLVLGAVKEVDLTLQSQRCRLHDSRRVDLVRGGTQLADRVKGHTRQHEGTDKADGADQRILARTPRAREADVTLVISTHLE